MGTQQQPLGELSWRHPPFCFLGSFKKKVGGSSWDSKPPLSAACLSQNPAGPTAGAWSPELDPAGPSAGTSWFGALSSTVEGALQCSLPQPESCRAPSWNFPAWSPEMEPAGALSWRHPPSPQSCPGRQRAVSAGATHPLLKATCKGRDSR